MSDIQPTEAEREDVRRLLIAWGKPDGLLKEITSIKADVVKAEREALEAIDAWWRLPNSKRTIDNIEPAMRLVVAILSDDQEARRG